MKRGLTGHYTPSIAGGVRCQAFVPGPLPPRPPLALEGKLNSRINRAMLALGRLDAITTLLPDAQLFLYSYVRKEAVMSSQIEGTQSSINDLMLYEMKAAPGVPLDDAQEVSCYVSALDLGVKLIREGFPISFRLITDVHRELMTSGRGHSQGPGEFRRNQVWIGSHRPDEAMFVPPPPTQLADCWAALEQFINDVPEGTDPLIKAALAHAQFETIHPFLDGNGRLGRLLIPLILLSGGVLREPLLYLSVFFRKHRQAYYDCLQQIRTHGDWESWVLFFVDAVTDTAEQAVETAQRLNQLRDDHRQRLPELGRIAGSAHQVLEALFGHPVASVNSLCEQTGLTAATVGKVLEAFEHKLAIVYEATGQKRNRVFVYKGYLDILNQE